MQKRNGTETNFLTPDHMAMIARAKFTDAATGAVILEAFDRESAAGFALSRAVNRVLPVEESESLHQQLDLF